MLTINSIYRERLEKTLAHKPVDRCPIDLGGTPQSTIETEKGLRALASYLRLEGSPPQYYTKFDERILTLLDIDFRRVGDLVPFTTNLDQKISDTEYIDCYGIKHKFTGMYWEISGSLLQKATIDDLASYKFPDISQAPKELVESWKPTAKYLYENTPYVIIGEHPVFGVLELACWLCGYDHIMEMMALDPDFIHYLFGRILEFQKGIIKEYYTRIGKYIHITTSGDDFGTQSGMFMSPTMWREFVKPYMEERIKYTAQFTDAVYMHHSCGSIDEIIPDLVEIGVRILNPIQPKARGMEPSRLKSDFGNIVTFHGGLDTQEVLPSNDIRRIEGAVSELIGCMKPQRDGGYIFAPAHNFQDDVSPKSIIFMYLSAFKCQDSKCPAMDLPHISQVE